jgi:DNA-binding NtrC family response regulator/tetratricopeptide (TPR) repeat protein
MDVTLDNLVREGRFKAALDHVRVLPAEYRRRTDVALTEAELLVDTGEIEKGFAAADRLGNREMELSHQIIALRVMGKATFYQGDVRESRALLTKARELAMQIRRADPELFASILLRRWRLSTVAKKWIADRDFDELRRAVLRSGSPHHIAELRVCVAEIETQKYSPHEALRHLNQSRKLLESYPNSWLESVVCNHTSLVFLVLGDIEKACEYAKLAVSIAEGAGVFRIRIAAQVNLAELEIIRGNIDEADVLLKRVLSQVGAHAHFRMAALDACAKVYLARNDIAMAKRAFGELLKLKRQWLRGVTIQWAGLSEEYTRARILEAEGRTVRAQRRLARGIRHARSVSDRVWETKMRLRLAQLSAQKGDPVRAAVEIAPALNGASERVETILELAFARAATAKALGDAASASHHQERGLRIATGLGLSVAGRELSVGRKPVDQSATAAGNTPLDDAVALVELAGYPHVLAREAYALLDLAGATTAQALIARGDTATRAVAARGWTDAQAVAAAAAPGERLRIVCGVHRDETWEIFADLKPTLNDRCTGVAIRKLVDTAVTLDRYRREEKQRAALWPADTLETDGGLWVSEQMTELLSIARRIAPADITVLLTGETGTGKEVLARAIHRASGRAAQPFVPFNCTAVPREMLESQLFGYKKGAFTGAESAFDGVIRAAAGGTIFLDEIAEIGPELQPKLLRFLETREVHGLGEPQPVKVDVRIIAATNADLETLISESRFREDLFYRLNVVRLRLPPLRERREEIPPLIDHYLRKVAEEQKKGHLTLDDETLEYLVLYAWPGNVRQLVNEISRVVAYAEPDGTITPALLSPEIQASRKTVRVLPGDEPEIRVRLDQPLNDAVEAIERVMVVRALDRAHGNYENAAKLLGISRKGLFLKRRRWGMQRAS